MANDTKNKEQLTQLIIPYGQIALLARRFRTTPKSIRLYLNGEYDKWSKSRAKQMIVRKYAIKKYSL